MDVTDFFETVLFSWITGNNDMHLKNFSLYEPQDGTIRLTPAYDLLNAAILNPKDDEELALTLNGRKKRLKRTDFVAAGETMGIDPKTVDRLIGKYVRLYPRMSEFIGQSFLDEELKNRYNDKLRVRLPCTTLCNIRFYLFLQVLEFTLLFALVMISLKNYIGNQ